MAPDASAPQPTTPATGLKDLADAARCWRAPTFAALT